MAFSEAEAAKLLSETGRLCCICRKQHRVSLHHIVPKEEGGSDDIVNALPLCPNCHDAVHGGRAPGRTTKAYTPQELRLHRQRTIEFVRSRTTRNEDARLRTRDQAGPSQVALGDGNVQVGGDLIIIRKPETVPQPSHPPGSIGANLAMRGYIEYLVTRYNDYRKADRSFGKRGPSWDGRIHEDIKSNFGTKTYFIPEGSFHELADYLQGRVDDTILGKRNKHRGVHNYHSFDEHCVKHRLTRSTTKLRTLYLQKSLSINGRGSLRGRVLFDQFRSLSDDALLGHIICSDADASAVRDRRVANDFVAESALRDLRPNVVYIEGGLLSTPEGHWKIPQDIATGLCHEGAVIIIADAAHNEMREQKAQYRSAAAFLGASACYGPDDDPDPVYAADARRFWKGHRQILCDPSKMDISSWLRPVYAGISEVLVGLPVRLSSFESILATCNRDTSGTLQNDLWVDQVDACPFASVKQVGDGFIVFIAAEVSGDVWLEGCPSNPVWLTNLAAFLVGEAERGRSRRTRER